MPACAITSTVLASSWSFCLVAFNAGRNNVGPNTIAKLCSDILFSFSCWCTLCLKDEFSISNNYILKIEQNSRDKWTYFNKWSKMKLMVDLLCIGISAKIFCSSWLSSFSLMLLNLLNVSMSRRYRTSVNRVSGNSRRYDLKMPVTEWMSTSFNSCSAS